MRRLLPRPLGLAAAALLVLTASTAAAAPKERKVLPRQISDEIIVVDKTAMVPVDDLIAAVGCKLQIDAKSRIYEGWPCKQTAAFKLDVKSLKSYSKGLPMPGQDVAFNPQPDPPHELQFDDIVASRNVVVHKGRGYLALTEVAALMGGTVKHKGKKTWIAVPGGDLAPIVPNATRLAVVTK